MGDTLFTATDKTLNISSNCQGGFSNVSSFSLHLMIFFLILYLLSFPFLTYVTPLISSVRDLCQDPSVFRRSPLDTCEYRSVHSSATLSIQWTFQNVDEEELCQATCGRIELQHTSAACTHITSRAPHVPCPASLYLVRRTLASERRLNHSHWHGPESCGKTTKKKRQACPSK